MSDFDAAVERAQSRAAVLQSLQQSYGSGKLNSSTNTGKLGNSNSGKKNVTKITPGTQNNSSVATTSSVGVPVNNSDKGVVGDMVDTLMAYLGDQTMKSKQFFKDSLRGKAIVVENVKAQMDASKASKRIEL